MNIIKVILLGTYFNCDKINLTYKFIMVLIYNINIQQITIIFIQTKKKKFFCCGFFG